MFEHVEQSMGKEGYPSDWDTRRASVHHRDDYTCQNCGRSDGADEETELSVHHIIPTNDGGTHSKANLTTMCSECYNTIHNDVKAPTMRGSLHTRGQLTTYHDTWEILSDLTGTVSDKGKVHLIAFRDGANPHIVVGLYRRSGNQLQRHLHKTKRKLSSFDPYENADSDRVSKEFKDLFAELIRDFLSNVNQLLELDRLLKKYIRELAEIECSNCKTIYNEAKDFCGECGGTLNSYLSCSDCGEIREDIKQNFCHDCGSEMNDYPKERLNQLELTTSRLKEEKYRYDELSEELIDLIEEVTSLSEIRL